MAKARKLRTASATKADLGSGLDALFSKKMDKEIIDNPAKVVKDLASNFAMIPIESIERNPEQPRKDFDEDALAELSQSIRQHGLIQPITVRRLDGKTFQIISGERRWRASKLAPLTEVPAYIRIANDQALMEMALIENIQRENLNAYEIAATYYRLKDEFALTDQELALRVGKERSTITNYIGILDLHPDAIAAVKEGKIFLGHAKALKGIADKLLQKKALEEILKGELSVTKSWAVVKKYQPQPKPAKKKATSKAKDEGYKQILEDFREFFGTGSIKFEFDDKEKSVGRIVIPFNNVDELNEFFKCVEQI